MNTRQKQIANKTFYHMYNKRIIIQQFVPVIF